MAMNASFEQILKTKMSGEPQTTSTSQQNPEPAHLAFLLGQLPIYRIQTATRQPRQNQTRTPKSASTKPKSLNPIAQPAERQKVEEKVQPKRPANPPHVLTERQKAAMTFFTKQGEALLPDFTPEELKKAFRRLARKLHPDASQSTDATIFIELKTQATLLSNLTK